MAYEDDEEKKKKKSIWQQTGREVPDSEPEQAPAAPAPKEDGFFQKLRDRFKPGPGLGDVITSQAEQMKKKKRMGEY